MAPTSDPAPSALPGFLLADPGRVARVLDALAARILAEVGADASLVGILRRGGPIAAELEARLGRLRGRGNPVGSLRLTRYDDDLRILHPEPELGEAHLPFPIPRAEIVLVDDVLYSGRTLLSAASYLLRLGAGSVRIAVLCAREGIEVPVRADFVGMRLEVGDPNRLEIHAPPFEPEWGIRILRRRRWTK